MTKPTIVCLPGAWHTPEIYADTFKVLERHGYPTVGLPLPSVGADPPHPDFSQDVEAISKCLHRLVEVEGREVVLVSHSYSGIPAGEAPVGLGKPERLRKGLAGGVIRWVVVMGCVVPEGYQPPAGHAEWMKPDLEKGVVTVTADDAKRIFYNDISSEEGDKWVAKLQHQSIGALASGTSYAAWRHIPSTYVVGTEDKSSFSQEVVRGIIDAARKIEPGAFDVVETCDAGHCLMISRPEWFADVLRRAAGERT